MILTIDFIFAEYFSGRKLRYFVSRSQIPCPGPFYFDFNQKLGNFFSFLFILGEMNQLSPLKRWKNRKKKNASCRPEILLSPQLGWVQHKLARIIEIFKLKFCNRKSLKNRRNRRKIRKKRRRKKQRKSPKRQGKLRNKDKIRNSGPSYALIIHENNRRPM